MTIRDRRTRAAMALLAAFVSWLPALAQAAPERSAGEVVLAFLEAANRGECASARALFMPAALANIEEVHGSFEAYCAKRSRQRTISATEIMNDWPRAAGRTDVRVRTHYVSGLAIDTEYLEQVGGTWKISWAGAVSQESDWAWLAASAEKQGRKADAWVYHRLLLRADPSHVAARAAADRLWKELGGSDEGRRLLGLLEAPKASPTPAGPATRE